MISLSGERQNAKGIIADKINSIDTVRGTSTVKRGFAHMLKNGVVMDVTTVEQALDCRRGWCCFCHGIGQASI